MKKIVISLSILILASNLFSAESKTVIITNNNAVAIVPAQEKVKKKSFVESISIRPYASAYASLNDNDKDFSNNTFDFTSGAVGLELGLPIYKNVDLCLDAVGIDSVSDDPIVDRVGLGINVNFPIKASKFAFYGQSGLGYWIDDENLDMLMRAGAKYNFTDHFGLFSDIGFGVSLQDGNSYQQLRGGLSFSF